MLISDLMHDAFQRRAIEQELGVAFAPMSVWNETDHDFELPRLPARRLPRWERLTETMKMFIGWDIGMEFGVAFTFTSHIDPDLMVTWIGPEAIRKNVEQRLRRTLRKEGIADLPFCYILEGRSRSGRSSSRIHLHGYALCEDPVIATKIKVALEGALNPTLKRSGRKREIWVKRANPEAVPYLRRERWPLYMAKYAGKYHGKLARRRVYSSQSLTEIAREAWAVRREK